MIPQKLASAIKKYDEAVLEMRQAFDTPNDSAALLEIKKLIENWLTEADKTVTAVDLVLKICELVK